MIPDTSKLHTVYPHHRAADPWPLYSWQELERATNAYVLALRWCWAPPRKHPAHVWYTACQVPGKTYCRLANIPYEVAIRQSSIYQRAAKHPIHTFHEPGPVKSFIHRQLDKLIAWRQAAFQ